MERASTEGIISLLSCVFFSKDREKICLQAEGREEMTKDKSKRGCEVPKREEVHAEGIITVSRHQELSMFVCILISCLPILTFQEVQYSYRKIHISEIHSPMNSSKLYKPCNLC